MKRVTVLAALCFFLVAVRAQILAENTWCYTNHPDAVFCDDFDRYCTDPPPWPQRCDPPPGVDIRDGWAMNKVWDSNHNCGWGVTVHDECYSSYPYSAKIGCAGWNNELGYTNTGVGSAIQSRFGSPYTQVLATDLTPLTVEIAMNGQIGNRMNYANLYMELGLGRGSPMAPGVDSLTNWIISPNCSLCGYSGNQNYYPIICRQSPTPAGCANPSALPNLPVLAAGFLAFLDQDPCHCTATDHWPRTDHLAFFDGHVWYTLHKGDFPDPGGSEPAPGDFAVVTGNVSHQIRLTIKSTTVLVELRVAGVLSRCQIPRAYMGPFNSLLMGYQMPCQLVAGTWDCNGAADCNGPCGPASTCCVSGSAGGGTVAVDNFVLYGGQGYAEQGACCFPDTTCVEAYQGDCHLIGGQPGPAGSTCQTHACCPPLPADHDMDGDVDMQDFGWFQSCLSGVQVPPPTVPCRCADFDHDNDVDSTDLATFLGCLLGPGIAANPSCVP